MKSVITLLFAGFTALAAGTTRAAVPLGPALAESLLQKSGLTNQLARFKGARFNCSPASYGLDKCACVGG